jgi:uncharacterized protein involved in exopolysaccharide biosynthesis
MTRYVDTGARLRFVLAVVVLLVLVPGLVAAYQEYISTHESFATVWVDRVSRQIVSGSDDPNIPMLQSPASEQAEILNELIQTRSFMVDVIGRTQLAEQFAQAADSDAFLDEERKRFRVQALGTNLVRISFRSSEPELAAAMVDATLAARASRIFEAQANNAAAAILYYQRVYESAQTEVIGAQQQLDSFTAAHPASSLSATDEYRQRQLRLNLDLASARVSDLKSRIETAGITGEFKRITGDIDFQVIDKPMPNYRPSGGVRTAALIAAVSLAGALALAALLVAVATLTNDRLVSAAELARVPGVQLLGTLQRVPRSRGRRSLMSQLVSAALPPPQASSEPPLATFESVTDRATS